ncbi:MAG: T9SS type A sorting domain-containing protein [Bacteroidetes bacterium]|nr:T9SS type A sorting domain-containing protein [Bacteroidota bacterium]
MKKISFIHRSFSVGGLILLSSFLTLFFAASAQPYMNPNILSTAGHKTTLGDVSKSFDQYWDSRDPDMLNEQENAEEGGYQQFKRAEAFMKQRTFPSGNFFNPEVLYKEYLNYKPKFEAANSGRFGNGHNNISTANWTFIGPAQVPGGGGGAGRINCLTIDPVNSNTLWIGAACGGLWKSTDGGATWGTNTDLLPSISISDIVIDPTNTSIMYLATGDKYGIYWQYETIGQYSAGLLKSTDGGLTWNPTGLNYTQNNVTIIQRLIMNPSNTSMMYAATNNGIYITSDAGATWTQQVTGKYYDIEFCPNTPTTLYCGDSIRTYKTVNGGTTWSPMPTITSTGRTSIAVTPANPNAVFVWSEGGGFYYSNNLGVSFITRSDPNGAAGPYGYYDYVLAVSPIDENILFAGGLNVARSTNGGTAWTTVSDWSGWPNANYSHADNHDLQFGPASSQVIYSMNDGGIFKSTNQGGAWTDLSSGLDIKQYYRLACSYQSPGIIYAGAQDNGTDRVNGATSYRVNGADGEECLVDYGNENVVFVSSQGGYFQKSTDGGNTFTGMSASGSDWTSPIIMDRNSNNIMYLGSTAVQKSTDTGDNWSTISPSQPGAIYSLEVSYSAPNTIYAATFGNIIRTTNGTSWTDITGPLPVGQAAITGIAISSVNPDVAWVTFSGYAAGQKVYQTDNGGTTWVNVSGTLPNIPVNCIEYQDNSTDILYIGTDFGVFWKDGTMNDWLPYNTNLPNVIIDELEIYYPTSKLRAATYGRGIWETDLAVSTLLALDCGVGGIISPAGNSCDTTFTPVIRVYNYGVDTLHSFVLHYYLDAQSQQTYTWNGALASLGHVDVTLASFNLTGGAHTFTAFTSDPNTFVDQNPGNDSRTSTFSILSNPSVVQAPITEGFSNAAFPPPGWTLENSSGLWIRSTTVGGFGTSSQSAQAQMYSINSGEDKIISGYIDFTNLVAPITLSFDVAYAQYSTTYHDSLIVDLYSDCDAAGTRVYAKGDALLSTAPLTTNIFVPTSSQWRNDVINLDSYAGHSALEIRIIAKTGYGNDLYLDNININGINVGIGEAKNTENHVSVFPNPASGKAFVEVNASQTKNVSINVLDLLGNSITSINDASFNGMKRYEIDLNKLSAGIYFIKVDAGDFQSTQRINVIH